MQMSQDWALRTDRWAGLLLPGLLQPLLLLLLPLPSPPGLRSQPWLPPQGPMTSWMPLACIAAWCTSSLLVCTLHCHIRLHLQNAHSAIKLLRISRQQPYSINQVWGPFWERVPLWVHRSHTHEACPSRARECGQLKECRLPTTCSLA